MAYVNAHIISIKIVRRQIFDLNMIPTIKFKEIIVKHIPKSLE